MKEFFKPVFADKIIFYGNASSLGILVLTALYLIFTYNNLPPFIPLFNQMPWGELRLGIREEIFLPLGIGLCTTIVNGILASIVYTKIPLLSRIIAITSFLVGLFIILFTIRTIWLVL